MESHAPPRRTGRRRRVRLTARRWDTMAMIRILGFYLTLAAAWELVACYSYQVAVFLLPRTGWAILITRLFSASGDWPVELPEVLSASWLLSLGTLFMLGKRPLRTYIASEIFLALPTIWFAAVLVIEGGGHVVGTSDGLKLLVQCALFTVVPVGFAIRELLKRLSPVIA